MMQRSRSSMRARSSGCGRLCLPGRSRCSWLYRFIHPPWVRVGARGARSPWVGCCSPRQSAPAV
jgi:hypothetical protein